MAFQIRANYRHHDAHVYTVTPGPVREQNIAVRSVITVPGTELADVESLARAAEGRARAGDFVRRRDQGRCHPQLVAFGDSLGIPVKYVCLVDYSNSRGASDMGLSPGSWPGLSAAAAAGPGVRRNSRGHGSGRAVGGRRESAEGRAAGLARRFVIVQDLFMTETAQRADILFPAASAYEKHGTVTNVCGEVQRLKGGVQVMGTKPDLEILGLLVERDGRESRHVVRGQGSGRDSARTCMVIIFLCPSSQQGEQRKQRR